jgi:uncharacterized Rmd1/YagE family protein
MDDDLIEGRFDLLDERLEHISQRLVAIEGDKEIRKSRALEWLVIVLVALEAAFEILLYFRPHA